MKRVLQLIGLLLAIFLLYLVGVILLGHFTYYSPNQVEVIRDNAEVEPLRDSSFTALIWNIGFAGLGAESDFFYDGGKQTRSTKKQHRSYWIGIQDFLSNQNEVDFVLLQEVDTNSKRSRGTNEKEIIDSLFRYSDFGFNYKVKHVPLPFTKPLGYVNSGLLSASKFEPQSSSRIQFPGSYSWPNKLFFLRRCMLVQRFPIGDSGKELVIINAHLSAYDDGSMKQQELELLKEFIVSEFQKENAVVIGADWNIEHNSEVIQNFLPDWQLTVDATTPTNRSLEAPLNEKTTKKVIDYFFVSPNVDVQNVETINLNFQSSDHQPVRLDFQLK